MSIERHATHRVICDTCGSAAVGRNGCAHFRTADLARADLAADPARPWLLPWIVTRDRVACPACIRHEASAMKALIERLEALAQRWDDEADEHDRFAVLQIAHGMAIALHGAAIELREELAKEASA